MGRARKQKHGYPLLNGKGQTAKEDDPTIPRQAKTSAQRAARDAEHRKARCG